MDARTIAGFRSAGPLAVCCRAVSVAIVVLLGLMSLLFVWRSGSGQLRPLDNTPVLVACIGLVLVLVLARAVWTQATLGRQMKQADAAILLLPSVTGLLIAISISRPDSLSGFAFLCTMVLFVGEATWTSFRMRRVGRRSDRQPVLVPGVDSLLLNQETPPAQQSLAATASQQLTRVQAADGIETMTGMLRGSFVSGQRTQAVHVAFCPPLETVPVVKVAQLEGPPAVIKVGQVESFGARFDVRLSQAPAGQTSVVLEFAATTEQPVGHAA